MTEHQATVAVRGEVTREVEPDLARVVVTVEAHDRDRHATLDRLGQRSAALRALLDRYADAIEARETSAVHIWPDVKRSGEQVRAYRGSVTTTVVVTDFAVLGELLTQAASLEQTGVFGPMWSLRPDSPAYREARHAAIADALTRARDYAQALGARLVRLVELADTGLSGGGGVTPGLSFAAAQETDAALELDPQRQLVQATVEARFIISEPNLPS